jgi:hypothetical protein
MAACRNVLQEDDILCQLFEDRSSDVSDYSDNESVDSAMCTAVLRLHERYVQTVLTFLITSVVPTHKRGDKDKYENDRE